MRCLAPLALTLLVAPPAASGLSLSATAPSATVPSATVPSATVPSALGATRASRVAPSAPRREADPEEGLAEDAGAWLDRLASGSAHERDRAQRWLGVHLTPDDYPLLADRARAADAEMARRLVSALGSEPRHLAVAVLLLDEDTDTLRTIGSAAFEDLVTRWCPKVTERSRRRLDVVRTLSPNVERRLRVSRRQERLELTVDRFSRLAGLGAPVVLDPSLAGTTAQILVDEGDPLRLLADFTLENKLTFSGIGDWSGEFPGRGAFVLVSEQSGALSRSGAVRLMGWCLAVERDAVSAAPAARALATTGWPAALLWLDRRWRERRDGNALEGLLAAASYGRASRTLLLAPERAALVARADQALADTDRVLDRVESGGKPSAASSAQRFAERAGRALIGAGPLTLGGVDDSAALLVGWDERTEAQRWWRLWVLEGQRGGGARVRDHVVGLLAAREGLTPALRFQALRTLAAAPERPLTTVQVAELPALTGWAVLARRTDELVVLLHSLGVPPDPASLGTSLPAKRIALHWLLRARSAERAGALLAELVRGASSAGLAALRDGLEAWRLDCGPELLREVTAVALGRTTGADREALARTALLAGCLDGAEQRALWGALKASRGSKAVDWEAIGALAAGPSRGEARKLLLEGVETPPRAAGRVSELVRGVDLAVAFLVEAGAEDEAQRLIQAVHLRVADPRSSLHARLSVSRWPRERLGLVVDLRRLERELPESLR